jgi:kumamolisin
MEVSMMNHGMTVDRHHTILPGSERELLPNSRRAGSVDPNETASITVRVRSTAGPGQLEGLVKELYSQPLEKRRYLTRDELASRFGASEEDLDKVERYAQGFNLLVTHRSARERTIVLKGFLKDLLTAFPASVAEYHHARGTYRGRRGNIRIPTELDGIVTGIFGFDTRPKHRSRYHARRAAGPGGANGVPSTAFAKRYNFPASNNGAKIDGTGQAIGIIELGGGYRLTDVRTYFKEIGIPAPGITSVLVDHGGNHPTNPNGADGEVMLDVEVAGAVAPGAQLVVYFAPNKGSGLIDAINAAVHDASRNPSVLSISWGEPEDFIDQQSINAYHEIFLQAAALGVTICVASGDHGTADMQESDWDDKIHVDHPSSDPMVLSCGGTQIDAKDRDVVWNDGTGFDTPDGGWAGGGGVSTVFPLPDYQQGANVPASLVSEKVGRGVPDVAMSATDYFVRVDGYEGASGGTSAVAPLMAGLVALLNQAGKKRVGFLNPFLYANVAKGVVHDVTDGTNAINGTVKGYAAGKGWDPASGLGTPDGAAILKNL